MQRHLTRFIYNLYRNKSFVHDWRTDRMRLMFRLTQLPPKARVIDLGGSELNWNLIDHDFHVTFINLPGWNGPVSDPSRYTAIDHDACDLHDLFEDNAFDLAFSNSTIEHVGDESEQARFASEARRLAPAYWIQTPSPRFPLEVHTGIPFYWKLPNSVRRKLMDHWNRKIPGWAEMVQGTRVLTEKRLHELFPDGQIYREKKFGFEKSYSMYRPFQPSPTISQAEATHTG